MCLRVYWTETNLLLSTYINIGFWWQKKQTVNVEQTSSWDCRDCQDAQNWFDIFAQGYLITSCLSSVSSYACLSVCQFTPLNDLLWNYWSNFNELLRSLFTSVRPPVYLFTPLFSSETVEPALTSFIWSLLLGIENLFVWSWSVCTRKLLGWILVYSIVDGTLNKFTQMKILIWPLTFWYQCQVCFSINFYGEIMFFQCIKE